MQWSLRSAPAARALLAISTLWLAMGSAAQASTYVYVSNADSQDISVLELDRSQGVVKPVDTVPVAGTVMPMVVSQDKKFLYAALRSQPFRVTSFSIDATNGKLKKNRRSAAGRQHGQHRP